MSRKSIIFICLLFGALRFLWPGDVPFIFDEPELISRAVEQNAQGAFTTHGLRGSKGIDYGPVPLLFYRGLVACFHNPLAWVLVKVLLITALTFVSVFWFLALFPNIPFSVAAIPFLSPYLWFYSRDLWDNSLNQGITALLLVSYFSFLRHRAAWRASLVLLGMVVSFQIHLMSFALIGAIVLHALLLDRAWWGGHKKWLLVGGSIALAISLPYLLHLFSTSAGSRAFSFRSASFFFSFFGARLISAAALEYFYGPWWFFQGGMLSKAFGIVSVGLTLFAFIPCFYGLFDRGKKLLRWDLRGEEGDLTFLCVATLVLHLGLCMSNQLVSHPHYYGSVWFVFFALYGVGMRALWKATWARRAHFAYLAGLGASLVLVVENVHIQRGNRQLHYGPTLSNLVEVAAKLSCYPNSVSVVDQRKFPFTGFRFALRPFVVCPGPVDPAARELRLSYRYLEDPFSGEIQLEPLK